MKKSTNLLLLFLLTVGFFSCGNEANKTAMTDDNQEMTTAEETKKDLWFKLSLAQWSLHRTLEAGEMDNLDFPAKARELGFDGVEWVAHFFKNSVQNEAYLQKMVAAAKAAKVENLLIMVDGFGDLAANDKAVRDKAVEDHKQWVDAAKFIGAHSIRVNLFGKGTPEEWHAAATDGLGRLAEYGKSQGINVIVENHGGLSSDSGKLVAVMQEIGADNVGTLPDFGNFCIARKGGDNWEGECINEYDRYKGTEEMMPYAKAVSAKSYDFNAAGEETKIDYAKMLEIVKDHKYNGFIGVEYEGDNLSEIEGIKATRDLLLAKAE